MNAFLRYFSPDVERYGDEVLHANTLPHGILSALNEHALSITPKSAKKITQPLHADLNIDELLLRLYRVQE